MPRREMPAETSRSAYWLRMAVNEHTAQLDRLIERKFAWYTSDPITWLSPVVADDNAEYYDESFLERLGVKDPKVPLRRFWPASGPRWDGLARTRSGRVLLVEAKAYIEEGVDFGSSAGNPDSVSKIEGSLREAQGAYKTHPKANWVTTPLYQYANRLAHLYYLYALNNIEAYLLFLYFADAPDVPNPSTVGQWEGAERLAKKSLGLGEHPFRDRAGTIVWSVPEMLAGR